MKFLYKQNGRCAEENLPKKAYGNRKTQETKRTQLAIIKL